MNSIATGDWAIECVLINDQTVINSDSLRTLKVYEREWVLLPAGQAFKVCRSTMNSAVLESNGETYYADFEVEGSCLTLKLSRQNVKETLTFEAIAINADVFISAF